jgi:hypothetical protein
LRILKETTVQVRAQTKFPTGNKAER